MKKLISIILCAIAFGMILPQTAVAQKNEKKSQKEKKAFVWEMPKLTGSKNFDDYLKQCDTLNTRIRSYCDAITFYQMRPIAITENGHEIDRQWCMVDTLTNTLRSSNKAFSQNLDLIFSYPLITLEMANLSLATTLATSDLPNLGMKSFSYAKYLKAGPKIVDVGGKEMKKIYKAARTQAKQIKDLKAGKVDDDYARNAEIEAQSVNVGEASMAVLISTTPIYMEKTEFEKQMSEVQKQDAENPISEYDIPEEVE